MGNALVAQGIEHRFPNPMSYVGKTGKRWEIRLFTSPGWLKTHSDCKTMDQDWTMNGVRDWSKHDKWSAVVTGRDSTTSNSRPPNGSRDSTSSVFTASSTISRRPRSRQTTLTIVRPQRPETMKRTSLYRTQAESLPLPRQATILTSEFASLRKDNNGD